jgi:uncharacterized membrane protein YqgA involved in biofilm formation
VPGIGVVVNVLAVLAGSAIGLTFGHLISERLRTTAFKALGLAIIVIGAKMSFETENVLVLVGALVLGALVGELVGVEARLEGLGHRLQRLVQRAPALKVQDDANGSSEADEKREHTLVEGFVSASLLYCVGAMTIVGSLQDGLGDPSILYVKALLDGIASIALASTLGIGVPLSVLPIAVLQGGLALGASWLEPVLTDGVVTEFTAVGGALILAIGLDIAGLKRLPYGNMLPAVVIAGFLGYFFG